MYFEIYESVTRYEVYQDRVQKCHKIDKNAKFDSIYQVWTFFREQKLKFTKIQSLKLRNEFRHSRDITWWLSTVAALLRCCNLPQIVIDGPWFTSRTTVHGRHLSCRALAVNDRNSRTTKLNLSTICWQMYLLLETLDSFIILIDLKRSPGRTPSK